MDRYDWWVDPLTERDEWRCVWAVAGELCKQICIWKLLKLFAGVNHKHWASTAHYTVSFHIAIMLLQQTIIYRYNFITDSQFGYSLSKPIYSCSLNTNGGLECLNSTTLDDHTRDLGVSCDSVQTGEWHNSACWICYTVDPLNPDPLIRNLANPRDEKRRGMSVELTTAHAHAHSC